MLLMARRAVEPHYRRPVIMIVLLGKTGRGQNCDAGDVHTPNAQQCQKLGVFAASDRIGPVLNRGGGECHQLTGLSTQPRRSEIHRLLGALGLFSFSVAVAILLSIRSTEGEQGGEFELIVVLDEVELP